jgi:hypothetical protein
MNASELEDTKKNDSESMSDANSSSDDDSVELSIDENDMALLMDLEQKLQANPQLYDTLVEYISTLRRCRLMERLKDARYTMHDAFPMTEKMWLEWFEDESENVGSVEDVVKLEELMTQSHEDYISVSLWKEHIEYDTNVMW